MAKTIARKITIYVDGRETEATLEGLQKKLKHLKEKGGRLSPTKGFGPMRHDSICEHRAVEVEGVANAAVFKICTGEVGSVQVGTVEEGVNKVPPAKVGKG